MSRRAMGVVVAVLAVLLAIVAARVAGVPIAGTAMAPPGLSAPAVGDCVQAFSNDSLERATKLGAAADTIGENSTTFAACSGLHIGEVIAYRQMDRQVAATDGDIGQVSDRDWCSQIAADYEASQIWRFHRASGGLWAPSSGQRFVAILSAPQVDPTEPRWAACTVNAPGLESYQGSFTGWLAGGAAPKPYGRCRVGDVGSASVSCMVPHRVQEFGLGIEAAPADQAAATCASLIAAMTWMKDVTAGGALRIDFSDGTVIDPAAGSPAGSSVRNCRLVLVGRGQLVGTLIGIGDQPLPVE